MEKIKKSQLISAYSVSKTFSENKRPILKSISLSLKKDEFLAVVGPSGCGKTTLLRILAELENISSGKIIFNPPDIKKPIVWQEHRLFPWLTVLENVRFPLIIEGFSKEEAERKAKKYIKLVKLEKFLSYYPHKLSGGMRQRVALARALVMEPKLILMDEPFASLDYQTKMILQEELKKLRDRFRFAVIYVTHDIRDATNLADRIVVLSKRPAQVLNNITVKKGKKNQADLEKRIWGILKKEISGR